MESRARRRLSGTVVSGALAATLVAGAASASVGRIEQRGVFALIGGTPKIVSQFWADHASGLSATLKVRQFQLDGKTPILGYDVEMQRVMHMVIVRDDFATFAHLHPAFDTTTGTFWQPFTKEPNHRYYVYADSTPHGIGQQVFRFTIESDGPVARFTVRSAPSATTAAAGPYTVTLSNTTLPANAAKTVDITILKGGNPAQDLGTYLGAAAHVVFVGTSTLSYAHVHPMVRGRQNSGNSNMNMEIGMGGKAGPFLRMTVPGLPAGTYKVWIQFLGGNDKLYTVPFTILAQ